MAKPKYDYWLSEDGLTLLVGWARDGLTDEQIAHNMNISRSTLAKWKNEHADISDALKNGKEVADYAVENALYKKALTGDVGAIAFWLKNRRSKKWRDKPDEDNSTGMEAIRDLTKTNLELAKRVQQETG